MEIDRKQTPPGDPAPGVSVNVNDNVNVPAAGRPPRIAVLMAVYEPRTDWLEEQLRSLDRQTILDSAADPGPAGRKMDPPAGRKEDPTSDSSAGPTPADRTAEPTPADRTAEPAPADQSADPMPSDQSGDPAAAGPGNPAACPVKLYIRDDASRTISAESIRACAEKTLQRLPFEFAANEANRGSSAVFEQLVMEAEGEWFAFCDQDDIWEPDKLEQELRLAQERKAALVCSDLRMIDAEGRVLADSITELRPRHRFAEGPGLAGRLIYRNFATGCTILMRADLAKQAVPFAKSMVHDHYLAFFSALRGDIVSCPEALVRYRQHGGNQTGVLYRITSKQEYIDRHLAAFSARTEELSRRFGGEEPELERARRWCAAREQNAARQPGGMGALWTMRHVNLPTSLFELICLRLPEPLFRLALKWIQAGKI